MRCIRKASYLPYHLEQRHQKETIPQNPDRAWHSFSHKKEITHFLAQRQYYLCAYCEINLSDVTHKASPSLGINSKAKS
jgi:hypothetical protein